MPNILEYTLSLKDQVTGTLTKIGITNNRQLEIWGKVQQKVTAADNTMRKCGVSIGSLRERIEALRAEREWIPAGNIQAIRRTNTEVRKLERQLYKLESARGGRIRSMLSNAFNSIPFANVLTNPIVVAGTAGFKALQQGFEREKVKVAFDVLIGDQGRSGALLSEIKQFGMLTPYMTADLQDSAKMMLSFGIASDKIMPNLKAIGDIAMGDREKMNALTLAFSQMTSTGKLMGQDLLQMINAGFNPLTEISRTSGKSVAVLKDEMSKGKITAEMVTEAFFSATHAGGQFYGMTEKMGQSKAGKWSTLLGKGTDLLLKLYDLIEPLVLPAMNALDKLIGWVGNGLELLSTAIRGVTSGFGWWLDKLREGNQPVTITTILLGSLAAAMAAMTVKAKAMALWAGIVKVATWAWAGASNALNLSLWMNPITWIIAAIIALIGIIAYVAYTTEGWGATWDNTMKWIRLSFAQAGEWLRLKWLQIQDFFMSGFEVIAKGWYKLQSLWDKDGAREGLAKIEANRNTRAAEIAAAKGKIDELAAQRKAIDIWQVKSNGKTLSDVTAGLKRTLGIETPAVPGMAAKGTGGGTGAEGDSSGGGNGTASSIATGGSKNTSITINLRSLVENLIFEGGYEGSREDMQHDLESRLIRVLEMAASAR